MSEVHESQERPPHASTPEAVIDKTKGWARRLMGGLASAGVSAALFANTDSHDSALRGIATVSAIAALALLANSLPQKKH